ncbi:hypothetical protein KO495_13885 [Colwellia sp. D2M02]|uniref:hypothetical protein n=1 Tax=Colwellia sp. D2M02 TaxID=2841562 RepID=UPI001C09132A|nr:hypothetical protein [Colwellia sp. D2M02]MBU2894400.1 hypothetical protein [Colwellia sp. D2M02]
MEKNKNQDTFNVTLSYKSGALGSFGVAIFTMPLLFLCELYHSYIWNYGDSSSDESLGIEYTYIEPVADPLWMIPVLGCFIGFLAKIHGNGMENVFRFVAIINYTLAVLSIWVLGLVWIEPMNMIRVACFYSAGLVSLLVFFRFSYTARIEESSIIAVPEGYTSFIKNRWVAIMLALLFGYFINALCVVMLKSGFIDKLRYLIY